MHYICQPWLHLVIILNYMGPRKILILYLPLGWGWEKYLTYPNSNIYNPTTVAFLWLQLRQSVYLYDCLSLYMCLPISVYLSLLHLYRSLLIAYLLQYLSVNLPPIRFGKISPFWQHFIFLCQMVEGLFSVWQLFEPTLQKKLMFGGSLSCCAKAKYWKII